MTLRTPAPVRARAALIFTVMLFWLAAGVISAQSPPALVIEAPPELAAARARLESFDRAPLAGIVRMVGLAEPGARMQVVLADERSDIASRVSPSTAGFAISDAGLIVLFPARSPQYPHDTLEDVLRHEVAHVLIGRAAGGQAVPRWFHEGLAVAAERPWSLEDRSRLAWELATGPRLTTAEIDRLFDVDAARPRAYSLSAALVRDIIAAHGPGAPAAILRTVSTGAPFEAAVAGAAGRPLRAVENEFWDRQRVWTVWVPLATSGEVLWFIVIGLAALAVWRRRRRAAEIRRRWDQEEQAMPPRPVIDRDERQDD